MSSTSSSSAPFGEKCCDPGVPPTAPTTGKEVSIAGVQSYVAGHSDKLILFSTDVFGQDFPNSRALADRFAAAGFTVVIPDLFDADPFTPERMASGGMAELRAVWFPKHPQATDKFFAVANELKKDKKYKSTQAVGYCYGAYHVIELLKSGLADAGVVSHPTIMDANLLKGMNKPMLVNCAEKDVVFTPDMRARWEKVLAETGADVTFLDYPGTEHGFAVRSDGSQVQEEQKEKATQATIEFLKKHA